MKDETFSRNRIIIGKEAQEKLSSFHIAVFGLGGVGGYALESLCRMGYENFTIVDFDTVSQSNINRQTIAFQSTVGKLKTELFAKRLKDINKNVNLRIFNEFYTSELNKEIFSEKIDYVVDAIDTMRQKIDLITFCLQNKINIVSCFGAANRLLPWCVKISDISELEAVRCKFMKNALRQLKKKGICTGLKIVYSDEKPEKKEICKKTKIIHKNTNGTIVETEKISPGSNASVVGVCGFFLSAYVNNCCINNK